MVNHRVTVIRSFEMNGHSGYITWNDNTQWHALVCETCPGQAGGGLMLDRWRRSTARKYPHEPAWQRHADPLNHPTKGQQYKWRGLTFVVTRVSEPGRWADIRIYGEEGWTKRQPLPLMAGSVLVGIAS